MLAAVLTSAFKASATVMAKDYSTVFNKARAYETQRILHIGDSLFDEGMTDNALVNYLSEEKRLKKAIHSTAW